MLFFLIGRASTTATGAATAVVSGRYFTGGRRYDTRIFSFSGFSRCFQMHSDRWL